MMARIDSIGLNKPFRVSHDWWNIVIDDKGNPPSRSLFIGNVPNGTRGSSIHDIFEAYGKIETSSPAAFSHADQGFALLTYRDIDSAQRAISRCYGQDLFNNGEICRIRFSDSHQQYKTPALELPSAKVIESRSEWFQQSKHSPGALARAEKIEQEDMLSRVEPTATQLPPTAPKKMLEFAKKVLTSPSAPRTTRVEISPPPLRRMDTYRPKPATLCEGTRRSSHEQRPKDIDRYVPDYRVRDEAYSSYRDDESHSPPRRARSPGWSSSCSQAFEARFSSSGDRRCLSFQDSTLNRTSDIAQSCDVLDRSEETVKPMAATASASNKTAVSSLENAPFAKRNQQGGATTDPAHAKEMTQPLPKLQVSALEDSPKPVVALPVTDNHVVKVQSLPSVTKAQEDLAASASTSPTWHRLRPPTDDSSSVTSSSSKSSQRKKQCTHCKAPDGVLLGTLVQCNACSRRYHPSCGTPRPDSTQEHGAFTCGRCLKKSRTSMSEQIRALSPELGTLDNDIIMADVSLNEKTKGSQDSEVAVQLPVSEEKLLTTRGPASGLAESKVAFDTNTYDISSLPANSVPERPNSGHVLTPPTVAPGQEEATRIHQESTKNTLLHPGTGVHSFEARQNSPIGVQRTGPASAYRRPHVTTEAEHGDRSVVSDFLPKSLVTASKVVVKSPPTNFDGQQSRQPQPKSLDATHSGTPRRQDTIPSPPTESSFQESSALRMAPTRIQKQAMEMVERYKNVTCPDWMSAACRYTSSSCNFAHYDTGIDLPSAARCNPHWTCRRWINGLPCPDRDRCPFAHTDTGLYVGINGKYSTKHLTCSFWLNGGCVHSDARCLFAHQVTGYSASGRVARDVKNRAKMTGQCRGGADAILRGPIASAHANAQPRALPKSPPLQESRPAASMVPAVDGRLFALNMSSPGAAHDSNTTQERLSKQRQAPTMKERTNLPPGSIETASTVESSPYSPHSTLGDHKGIHGVHTPFSPTSSITGREQDFIYGVDTPYSPMFTMATTEQSSPNRDNDGTNSKATSVSNPIHSEASSRLSSPYSPMAALTAVSAGSGASSVTRTAAPPQRTQERNKASTSVASATNTTTESRQDRIDKPLSNGESDRTLQGTDGKSRSDTQAIDLKSAVKAVPTGAVPSKHYAKRSTVDPRIIRRKMLASAAAKSASPVEGSVSSITSIKQCEKCDRRIFGSASFCISCSKDSTSARTSREGSPERSKNDESKDQRELRTSGESSSNMSLGIATFMEANAAASVLAVAQKHTVSSAADPTAAKSLKRPHEDAVFIQRKRPKVMVPLRKSSTTKCDRLASGTSQIQPVSIVDSELKFSEPQSIDQVESDRHENKATEPASEAASGGTGDRGPSVGKADQPDNYQENRRPSFSSMSQTTQEPNAKASEEEDGSEVTTTIRQNYNTSPPKESADVATTQPEIVAEVEDEDHVLSELSPSIDDPLPQQRIMLKLKVRRTPITPRCCTCKKHHKSCLHDGAGHMDPARCADYLERVKNGSRKHDNYWSSRLPEIRAAAKRYTIGDCEEEYEVNDDSDGLEIWQDAAEPMVLASPSSSVDPLGHIDTSTMQGLRPRAGKLDRDHSNASSTEKTKAKTLEGYPAIPTPAHTPSPAVGAAEIPPIQQTPSKQAVQSASKLPETDLKKVLGMLRKRGVQFDSEDDSDEDMEDTRSSATAQAFSWPPKASSLHLFEVAPALRRPPDSVITPQNPVPTIPNLRAGLSKKQLWKNLQSIQCAERRAKFGNPHKVVDRNLPSQMVKSTIQEEAPLTEQQRLAFHVPAMETKEVKIPFQKFLGMPEEPVVVRENTFRDRGGKVVEFDLAFRDGKKSLGVTAGGRMVGDGKVRWPFARG